MSREYTDYLKKHVSWEVVDYEDNIFRGWTVEEAKSLLIQDLPEYDESLPAFEGDGTPSPSTLIWSGSCIHEVRDQKSCGSCWAFATAGMLSDRCCIDSKKDHGWLSPQELVDCDTKKDQGCGGGWPEWALEYVVEVKGLVHEGCFPYVARRVGCKKTCADGKDWVTSHVCNCHGPKQCTGVENMKKCLDHGPMSVAFEVPNSFFSYKDGIYKCNGRAVGLHAVVAEGYGTSDKGECFWIVRNSWGTGWGMKGRFHIACTTCGIHGTYARGNVVCEKVE